MASTYAAILEGRASSSADAAAAGVVFHPKPKSPVSSIRVSKEADAFRIAGEKIERLAAMTDLETDDGRAYFDRVLARSGARRKLEKLGLRPGDIIRIGDREYTHT
jgi:GTP-binding protein